LENTEKMDLGLQGRATIVAAASQRLVRAVAEAARLDDLAKSISTLSNVKTEEAAWYGVSSRA
jgi:hypothetical protein